MVVWVLLPAFNEEASLPRLLPKLKEVFEQHQQAYQIVVVNDGSSDQTAELLTRYQSEYPLHCVAHKVNRGLGETERDGFEYCAEHAADEDIIVRLDCDDTHEPAYIFALVEKLNQGYDVVNTSRFQPGGGQKGVDRYRAFISYAANMFMKVVFYIPGMRDFSCGFRAYKAKILKDAIKIFGNGFIQLKGLGFTSTLETIVKLKLLGCQFAEVPFVLRYDKKVSSSKMVSSVTTLGYLTMAILYHWPWGGWRSQYKQLAKTYRRSPEEAYQKFSRATLRRSLVSQIGG